MGPLNSARHRDKVEGAIAAAAAEGATIVRYSTVPSDARFANGFFTQPALMTGVAATHRVFHEEIFGAALAITPFDDVEEAVALANATEYGLNAGIFTRHIDTAIAVALRVDAGQIDINGWGTGGAVEVPFGGFKQSGFGREKGVDGLLHYTQIKSITAHFTGRATHYRTLGRTGIKVSPYCLGAMMFGAGGSRPRRFDPHHSQGPGCRDQFRRHRRCL
jgi:acyl-CoA reductase-like NAD-dependent aldehyde dehydrogenase